MLGGKCIVPITMTLAVAASTVLRAFGVHLAILEITANNSSESLINALARKPTKSQIKRKEKNERI